MMDYKIGLIIVSIAFAITINYFLIDEYLESQETRISTSYEQGYEQGFEDTISILYEQLDNCNIATVTVQNSTKTIIDISCLEVISPNSSEP